jgi:hypothetical protein
VQEHKQFSDEYNEEFSRDDNRMYSSTMLVKNRTSNKKETNFTAPLIMLYNEPLLPYSASRLDSEEDVSDPLLMHKAIEEHFTLVACYPIYEETEEITKENVWEIGLEMAFGREIDFDEDFMNIRMKFIQRHADGFAFEDPQADGRNIRRCGGGGCPSPADQ